MKIYCLKCKKETEVINEEYITTKNNKNAIKGNCSECETKMFRLIRKKPEQAEQEKINPMATTTTETIEKNLGIDDKTITKEDDIDDKQLRLKVLSKSDVKKIIKEQNENAKSKKS